MCCVNIFSTYCIVLMPLGAFAAFKRLTILFVFIIGILIKSPKKLEDKVLPHFFRHKHLSSFVRQLNMYGFSKANKLTK